VEDGPSWPEEFLQELDEYPEVRIEHLLAERSRQDREEGQCHRPERLETQEEWATPMTPVTDDEADGQDSRHRHGPQGQQYTGDATGIPRRPEHREVERSESDGDHDPGDSEARQLHYYLLGVDVDLKLATGQQPGQNSTIPRS